MFKLDETGYEFYTPVLKSNFRHFAVQFANRAEAEDGFAVLQNELRREVTENSGRLLRIKRLPPNEVLVYLATRQNDVVNWKALLKQLLKGSHVEALGITAIGLSNMEMKGRM